MNLFELRRMQLIRCAEESRVEDLFEKKLNLLTIKLELS